jgi:hypothetical protein
VVYDHVQAYDAKGRVETDTVTQLQGSDIVTSITSNQYGDGTASYALGAVTRSTTSGSRLVNGSSYQASPGTATAIGYAWYDGAVQSQVDYTPNTAAPGNVQHSYYSYTPAGVLASVNVVDGRARTVTLTNDVYGQALRRDESDGTAWNPTTFNGGDPHEAWYRFNGRQLGSVGNNGTYENGYLGSLEDRTHTIWGGPGAFRYGSTLGMATVEFNDRLTPVNTYQQGGAGGGYTVREGDSLSGIAAQLWGDASLSSPVRLIATPQVDVGGPGERLQQLCRVSRTILLLKAVPPQRRAVPHKAVDLSDLSVVRRSRGSRCAHQHLRDRTRRPHVSP